MKMEYYTKLLTAPKTKLNKSLIPRLRSLLLSQTHYKHISDSLCCSTCYVWSYSKTWSTCVYFWVILLQEKLPSSGNSLKKAKKKTTSD